MTADIAHDHADERLSLLSDWLEEHTGGTSFTLETASADASFRRYFRIRAGQRTLIAMDAPPAQESVGAFVDVARRLRAAGVNAPEIIAVNERQGFVLLSDLGYDTYLQRLRAGAASEQLYADAIQVLVTMQQRVPTAGLPAYDEALLRREMALFPDWLLTRHLGLELSADEARHWASTQRFLVASALAQPRVFVHRDYHSRNLMVGAPGAPGVLDFQDAVIGPATYDLVSLLKDCYVGWPSHCVAHWQTMYIDLLRAALPDLARALTAGDWRSAFCSMGVQRHLKAAGIFARLSHRDGKHGYLADIPRTLGYIVAAPDAPGELDWLRDFVARRVLPAVTGTGAECTQ